MLDLTAVCNELNILACTLDENGNFIDCSSTVSSILGYSEQELADSHFTSYITKNDIEKSIVAWHALKAGTPIQGFKNLYVTRDGRLKCMEWSAVYNPAEKKCYCTGQVVSASYYNGPELTEADLYKKMFTDNPSPMFVYHPQTLRFVMVNKAACEQYGYTEEEFMKISVMDILPPERKKTFVQKLPDYLKHNVSHLPDRHVTKDGDIIEVLTHAESINYLNTNCRIVTIADITARKENEEKLQLLASVITHVTDGVMITDAEVFKEKGSRILYVNPAFEKQCGYTASELIGQFPDILGSPEANLKSISRMMRAMEVGEPFIGEIMNYNKSGEKYWVAVNIAPVKDEQGKVTNFIGVSRDITEYKKAEAEKQNLVNDLLNTSDRVKRFSYITSHNLRAPLTNIIAVVKLMENSQPNEETTRLISLLKRSANHLNETIEDLVNILMIKETQVEQELIDIREIWKHVLANNQNRVSSVQTVIHEKFSESWIRFNRAYLSSILQELLTNAIKFRRADVRLEIHISTTRTESGVQLKFQDNGMGLSSEIVSDRLFGLYQRFHSDTEGKGLGLFIMRSQIHAMNAAIRIETDVNKGFRVFIDIRG